MAGCSRRLVVLRLAGDKFTDVPETQELKGNNDLLVFTLPSMSEKVCLGGGPCHLQKLLRSAPLS